MLNRLTILPNTTENSPAYWRQEESINNVDHLRIKNGNIHAEPRPLIVRIKQTRLTKTNELKLKPSSIPLTTKLH